MPVIRLDDIQDPRLDAYRAVRDRDLIQGPEREGLFIAEGQFVVERMLHRPELAASLLLTERLVDRFVPLCPAELPIYVVDPAPLQDLTGFPFHRGVLASGYRERVSAPVLADLVPEQGRATLLACEGITNIDNIGLLFRNAAAFGVTGLLICPESCDPLYRKSLRVSAGNALHLPWYRSTDWNADLAWLAGVAGCKLYGAALGQASEDFAGVPHPERLVLLVGHEGHGLTPATREACDRWVQIPMAPEVDSLNVAVSAAVLLSRFRCDR